MPVLFFIFILFGWFLGSFVFSENIKSDNTNMLDLNKNEEGRIYREDIFDIVSNMDSLEFILEIENVFFRNKFLIRYANNLSTDEFEDCIEFILKKQYEYNEDRVITDDTPWFAEVYATWLVKDFESAKNYAINKKISSGSQYLVKDGILIPFILFWMKVDRASCMDFAKDEISQGDGFADIFINAISKHYPEEAILLIDEMSDPNEKTIAHTYMSFFQRNPMGALNSANSISSGSQRRAALSGILEIIQKDNPLEASRIISDEWAGEEQQFRIYRAWNVFSENNPEDAIMLIRQGDIPDSLRDYAYRGVAKAISIQKLNEILENGHLNLSEEEKSILVKNSFREVMGYGEEYPDFYSFYAFANVLDEKSEPRLPLLGYLPESDRLRAYYNIMLGNVWINPELSLKLYYDLPLENQDSFELFAMFNRISNDDPWRAALLCEEFVVNGFNEDFSEDMIGTQYEETTLSKIIDRIMVLDTEKAVNWINNLPDGPLKNQVLVTYEISKLKDNPVLATQYLESLSDQKLAIDSYGRLISENINKNISDLSKIILAPVDENWSKSFLGKVIETLAGQSNDIAYDFVNLLSENVVLHEAAIDKFCSSVYKKNPELALELSLEGNYNFENQQKIEFYFNEFQKRDPEGAKRWIRENKIEF